MDILLEQVVYGSFPFRDRGYHVLARSSGCRAEWLADVLAACRKFGEAPAGVTPASALFALPLASGPWAVVGVEPQGSDDRGRPGALAFHALLVAAKDYRKSGSNPFAFAGALRRDWCPETSLDAVFWSVEVHSRPSSSVDPKAGQIAKTLARGKRVALESPVPIDQLAREVWLGLPESTRRRASLATWSFGNANRFDLVGLPRLAGVELDGSYVDPGSMPPHPDPPPQGGREEEKRDRSTGPLPPSGPLPPCGGGLGWEVASPDQKTPTRPMPSIKIGWRISLTLTTVFLSFLAWRAINHPRSPQPSTTPPLENPSRPVPALSPEIRTRLITELIELADRFELGGSNEPGALMIRLSEQVHYRGPFLSTAEVDRLSAEANPDCDRALAWHRRLSRTFADDRPLADDFDRLPLERQLEQIAWSFHLDPIPKPEAIPGTLLLALSRNGPIQPTPLAARYPALTDYARFLGKLPRRESRQ